MDHYTSVGLNFLNLRKDETFAKAEFIWFLI